MNNRTMKARVGSRLLEKVTRLFDNSPETIFGELVQNARRAGATQLAVEIEAVDNANTLVIFTDDGCGIKDLADLLVLTDSGWDEPVLSDEDPAGMGLFCLSNLKEPVVVTSGAETVTLTPGAFQGEEVSIEPSQLLDSTLGTRIKFVLPHPSGSVANAIRSAVRFANIPTVRHWNGAVERLDSTALVSEEEAEIVNDELGYRLRASTRSGWHDCIVRFNFHGIIVEHSLKNSAPTLSELVRISGLSAEVELLHCKYIKMVLPARNAMQGGEAMTHLLEDAEKAIFMRLAKKGHKLPFQFAERARALGVDLPDPDLGRSLKFIRDEMPCGSYAQEEWMARPIVLIKSANPYLCVDFYADYMGRDVRYARPDESYTGYANYDALPVYEATLEVTPAEGEDRGLVDEEDGFTALAGYRPKPVMVSDAKLVLTSKADRQEFDLDFAVLQECFPCSSFGDESFVLYLLEGFEDAGELKSFMLSNMFRGYHDSEESVETQEREFEIACWGYILSVMQSPRAAMEDRVRKELRSILGSSWDHFDSFGQAVTIKVKKDGPDLDFTFEYV